MQWFASNAVQDWQKPWLKSVLEHEIFVFVYKTYLFRSTINHEYKYISFLWEIKHNVDPMQEISHSKYKVFFSRAVQTIKGRKEKETRRN